MPTRLKSYRFYKIFYSVIITKAKKMKDDTNNSTYSKRSVYAIFNSQVDLDAAVADLKLKGFRHSDISVLYPDSTSQSDLAHKNSTKAPEGATVGASTGAIIGGALGWLAGIGSLAIPGFGPFIAAGPIMGLLAGSGIGGATGLLAGSLAGLGIPEYEAVKLADRIKAGGILATVQVDNSDWESKAKEIFKNNGGDDISTKNDTASKNTRSDSDYQTNTLV